MEDRRGGLLSDEHLTDITPRLARAAATGSLLRLATAGSVDDSKSRARGRAFRLKSVLRDQLAAQSRSATDRGLTSADL